MWSWRGCRGCSARGNGPARRRSWPSGRPRIEGRAGVLSVSTDRRRGSAVGGHRRARRRKPPVAGHRGAGGVAAAPPGELWRGRARGARADGCGRGPRAEADGAGRLAGRPHRQSLINGWIKRSMPHPLGCLGAAHVPSAGMSLSPPPGRLRLGLPGGCSPQVLPMQVAHRRGSRGARDRALPGPAEQAAGPGGDAPRAGHRRDHGPGPADRREGVLTTPPARNGPVQREAERIRRATHAEYIVVLNRTGCAGRTPRRRRSAGASPPTLRRLGRQGGRGDPPGHSGALGARQVPLYDADHRVVGAVSVGIAYDSVRARLISAIPGLFAYAGGAPGGRAGRLADLAPGPAADPGPGLLRHLPQLLAEREAMLHGIREGVVALDRGGRIRLLNDEARRLLGIGDEAVGRTPTRRAGVAVRRTCWPAG